MWCGYNSHVFKCMSSPSNPIYQLSLIIPYLLSLGTSPPSANQNRLPLPTDQENNDVNEEANLVDHDDMFVLDMEPSLKTLCMLNVLKHRLETSHVPRVLQQELGWMRLPNRMSITPLSSG